LKLARSKVPAMNHEPIDGEGELWNRERSLLRARFHLDYPPRDESGWAEPPDGYVEPLDAVGREKLAEVFHQYRRAFNFTLRDDTHAMACVLTSAHGDLRGMGGWVERPGG